MKYRLADLFFSDFVSNALDLLLSAKVILPLALLILLSIVAVSPLGYPTTYYLTSKNQPGLRLLSGSQSVVQTDPQVYLIYWGWQGQDPQHVQPFLDSFFTHVGGSTWLNTLTQYCAPSPTAPCAQHAGNPRQLLRGTWRDDTNPIPPAISDPKQADAILADEINRAATHFANLTVSSRPNLQFWILTPANVTPAGFAHGYCGIHGTEPTPLGPVALVLLPDPFGTACDPLHGMDPLAALALTLTNPSARLDLLGANAGHELAETITDPLVDVTPAYADPHAEIADKCYAQGFKPLAWDAPVFFVNLNGVSFLMQPLWSNQAHGCVMSS